MDQFKLVCLVLVCQSSRSRRRWCEGLVSSIPQNQFRSNTKKDAHLSPAAILGKVGKVEACLGTGASLRGDQQQVGNDVNGRKPCMLGGFFCR